MSAINEPLGAYKASFQNMRGSAPLAGKRPNSKVSKPAVSKFVKLKPRPIKIYETK